MITILLPAYNEEDVIEKSISTISSELNIKEDYEILVINDGSKDKTEEILTQLTQKYSKLRYVSHEINKGLGAAIRTGFQKAKGRIIIELDADLTQPIKHVPQMIEKIDQGYDLCIASRYLNGGGMRNVPNWRVWLSKAANSVFSIIYLTKTTDLTSGYRAYRYSFIKNLDLKQDGFAIQLEISVMMAKYKARITEIPFILTNRSIGHSKFSFAKVLPKYLPVIIKLFFIRFF